MRQESTKEPAFCVGSWLRFCRGSFMKKTENLRDSSKLDPMIFSVFFSLLRKPAEHSSADCRFGAGGVSSAILLRRFSRSFRRSETAFPRRRNHTTKRQADHALRDRARETGKKKGLNPRNELARAFGFQTLFRIACRDIHVDKMQAFGRAREGLWPSKAASRTYPINLHLPPRQQIACQPSSCGGR